MKKILTCLLTFCMLFGLGFSNISNTITVQANDTNIDIIHKPLKGEEFNHVFTQDELKNTEYDGQKVEIKNGEVYVNENRAAATIAIYLLTKGSWVLVGLMTNGTIQALVDNSPDVLTAYNYAKEVCAIYQNRAKSVYANATARTATAYLTDGNQCVRASSSRYVCKYSVDPDKPIVE